MNVRWIPFDPPWLIVPYLGGGVLAAAVIANGGSVLVMWAIGGVAIVIGVIGVDRWLERYRPRR